MAPAQSFAPSGRRFAGLPAARRVQAPLLLERYFVSAVAAVLIIRGWLEMTGYPQIGGHGLHIAHMLFGGVAMLVALLAVLTFLGPRTLNVAAIVGGAGFGTFIDELGKFITSDNDYFYRPTIALIYVIFVLLFIAGERLARDANPTADERLAQALDVATGDVIDGYPAREREVALRLLAQSDPRNPLVPALRRALAQIAAAPDPAPGLAARMAARVADAYNRLVGQRWFLTLVLVIAGVVTAFSVRELSITIQAEPDVGLLEADFESTDGLSVVANLISGILLLVGLVHIRRSLLEAYRWFRRAVLVSLLVTQPLAFYQDPWTALIGLAFNLLLISALEFGIGQESAPAPPASDSRNLSDRQEVRAGEEEVGGVQQRVG